MLVILFKLIKWIERKMYIVLDRIPGETEKIFIRLIWLHFDNKTDCLPHRRKIETPSFKFLWVNMRYIVFFFLFFFLQLPLFLFDLYTFSFKQDIVKIKGINEEYKYTLDQWAIILSLSIKKVSTLNVLPVFMNLVIVL